MASEGNIVLSYHDTLLRHSDVELLRGNEWINDNILSFWYEYLEYDLYEDVADQIIFVSPQVSQFIKSASHNVQIREQELPAFLEALGMTKNNSNSKSIILMPINDQVTTSLTPGGTHWSLLVYFYETDKFEHFDSFSGSVNHLHAQTVIESIKPLISSSSNTSLTFNEMECTQQGNSYDCGIHVIVNSEAILRQMFRGADSHIADIASLKCVQETRSRLLKLIQHLKRQQNS